MRIVIACSRKSYRPTLSILASHEVLIINNKSQLSKDKLADFIPDIIFFPHWNWIVPDTIYESFKCIVFHTAPLPYGRGGSPIQNLILRGFKKVTEASA